MTSTFSGGEVNVTNQSATFTDLIEFKNNDGLMEMNVSIIETISDEDDDCDDYIGDITTEYELMDYSGSKILTAGDNLNLTNGNYILAFNSTIQKNACPQNITYSVEILPLEI